MTPIPKRAEQIEEFVTLCMEANRRCQEVRRQLITGELSSEDAAQAYAVATAPLAAAVAAFDRAELP